MPLAEAVTQQGAVLAGDPRELCGPGANCGDFPVGGRTEEQPQFGTMRADGQVGPFRPGDPAADVRLADGQLVQCHRSIP
jgi:hypothetical protein